MSNGAKVDSDLDGNTDIQVASEKDKKKRPNAFVHWCFTHFIIEDRIKFHNLLKLHCEKFIYQREICPTSEKQHFQGTFALKKKMRMKQVLQCVFPFSHLEVCRNIEASYDYCRKEETATGDRWMQGFPSFDIDCIYLAQFYPWQSDLFRMIHNVDPDPRSIIWIYETEGNTGKSSMAKWLCLNEDALPCTGGKKSDVINLVFNHDMNACRLIVFDLCRQNSGKVSFDSIEDIKNGLIVNHKYETGYKVFNPPHIVIFANCLPDCSSSLSYDRWRIYKIVDKKLKRDLMIE